MNRDEERESTEYVDPVIEAYKQGIDRTLIRENLKLTPQQRLEKLESLMRGIEEMNRCGCATRLGAIDARLRHRLPPHTGEFYCESFGPWGDQRAAVSTTSSYHTRCPS